MKRAPQSAALRAVIGVFVAALLVASASAQSADPACAPFSRITAALSEHDQDAVQALAEIAPPHCTTVLARIHQLQTFAAEHGGWRTVGPSGALATVEPPAEMGWGAERAIFHDVLTADMMIARPSVEDVNRLHPRRALERNQVGAAILEGRVTANGQLVWRVLDEAPTGWGFGDAGLRAASLFRAPTEYQGSATTGASFRAVIAFMAPPPPAVIYD